MKRVLLAVLAAAALTAPAAALEVPFLAGRVNDDARLLDAATASALEFKLKDYETRTGRQFAVLTIPSLAGESLEEYSLKVARTWKLGRKGRDDGILLLVARDDRRVRLEIGYGLEGALPDALCGRIIRDSMVPRFRGGDFPGGVTAGVDAVLSALGGSRSAGRPPLGHGGDVLFALLFGLLLLHAAFRMAFGRATPSNLLNFFAINGLVAMSANDFWGSAVAAAIFAVATALVAALGWASWNTEWGLALSAWAEKRGSPMHWFSSQWSFGGGGGGFSGGGGSFGGGGASGSW